ncbi:unnamed protein product [Arabidopsis halleri]
MLLCRSLTDLFLLVQSFFSPHSLQKISKDFADDDAIDNENENGARFQTSTYRRITDQDCTKQMDIDCDKDQHYNSRCNY